MLVEVDTFKGSEAAQSYRRTLLPGIQMIHCVDGRHDFDIGVSESRPEVAINASGVNLFCLLAGRAQDGGSIFTPDTDDAAAIRTMYELNGPDQLVYGIPNKDSTLEFLGINAEVFTFPLISPPYSITATLARGVINPRHLQQLVEAARNYLLTGVEKDQAKSVLQALATETGSNIFHILLDRTK